MDPPDFTFDPGAVTAELYAAALGVNDEWFEMFLYRIFDASFSDLRSLAGFIFPLDSVRAAQYARLKSTDATTLIRASNGYQKVRVELVNAIPPPFRDLPAIKALVSSLDDEEGVDLFRAAQKIIVLAQQIAVSDPNR